MDYIKIFTENGLSDINTFFNYMQNNFKYGWKDTQGNLHEGVNDALTYSLQSPEELLNSQVGICWDRTELCRCYFENMTTFKFETYYLFYDDNNGCPSHSILVFYNDGKVYWFEPMFTDERCYYSGIHEYENLEELLNDFKNRFLKLSIINNLIPYDYDNSKIFIYKYDKPNYNINGFEMRNHINGSEIINIKR